MDWITFTCHPWVQFTFWCYKGMTGRRRRTKGRTRRRAKREDPEDQRKMTALCLHCSTVAYDSMMASWPVNLSAIHVKFKHPISVYDMQLNALSEVWWVMWHLSLQHPWEQWHHPCIVWLFQGNSEDNDDSDSSDGCDDEELDRKKIPRQWLQ